MAGKAVNPVMEPLGFSWRGTVAALAGVPAKEIVVSTLGVLYTGDEAENAAKLGELHGVHSAVLSVSGNSDRYCTRDRLVEMGGVQRGVQHAGGMAGGVCGVQSGAAGALMGNKPDKPDRPNNRSRK